MGLSNSLPEIFAIAAGSGAAIGAVYSLLSEKVHARYLARSITPYSIYTIFNSPREDVEKLPLRKDKGLYATYRIGHAVKSAAIGATALMAIASTSFIGGDIFDKGVTSFTEGMKTILSEMVTPKNYPSLEKSL